MTRWARLCRPGPVGRRVGLEVLAVGLPLLAVLMSYPPSPWALPVAIAACLALPLRLKWPWLAFALCLPALYGGLGWPPALVALFRVGMCAPTVRLVVAAVAAVFLTVQVANQFGMDEVLANQIMSALFSVVVPAGPAALGVLVRLRAELSATLAERDQARRAELHARLDSARADERARITREIHDAVGHNTTLIAVQAAALSATTTDPTARETADHLRRLAKQSLAEMRAALGLTGTDSPQGLPELPALIAQAQAAGVDVEFTPVAATPSPLISRALYRVVQEALTNAVKHAPGAPITVTLTRDAAHIVATVVNGTPTRPPADLTPGGTGLEGLTERVRTAGGTLTTTNLPDGGFSLRAALPAHDPSKVAPTPPTSGGSHPLPTRQ
ncbi:sensor histidine kinase [Actinokineospora sp. UTMC 2448]|uniref:sensor histidine kinase n=1 Tax=Actinokineospora sp. UTMC 2448 TaxID=2268449 RepID=UPI00216491CD|nr:sensor histidine kinase [Actinokineospora sp. UTMC 2448]UVS78366.1 Sensor histidine kinase LiaS [Actinokineospora sp. UTMC 2448]